MTLPLARVFQCLFTFALVSALADWRKSTCSVDREPQGNWRWNSNSRDVVASSPSFSRLTARAPRTASSQATPSYMKVLIKIHVEFARFFKLQNVAKIEFISIQARGGGLTTECSFLLTVRWPYNCGAYKLKSTVDPPEKRDPAAGYRPGNLTNCFLHPFNSSQLIWK